MTIIEQDFNLPIRSNLFKVTIICIILIPLSSSPFLADLCAMLEKEVGNGNYRGSMPGPTELGSIPKCTGTLVLKCERKIIVFPLLLPVT